MIECIQVDLWEQFQTFQAMTRKDQAPRTFKQWLRTPEGREAQRGQLMLPLDVRRAENQAQP